MSKRHAVGTKVVFGDDTHENVRGQRGVVKNVEEPWHVVDVQTGPLAGTQVRVNGADVPDRKGKFSADHDNPDLAGHKGTLATLQGPDGKPVLVDGDPVPHVEPEVYEVEILTGPDAGKITRLHASSFEPVPSSATA